MPSDGLVALRRALTPLPAPWGVGPGLRAAVAAGLVLGGSLPGGGPGGRWDRLTTPAQAARLLAADAVACLPWRLICAARLLVAVLRWRRLAAGVAAACPGGGSSSVPD